MGPPRGWRAVGWSVQSTLLGSPPERWRIIPRTGAVAKRALWWARTSEPAWSLLSDQQRRCLPSSSPTRPSPGRVSPPPVGLCRDASCFLALFAVCPILRVNRWAGQLLSQCLCHRQSEARVVWQPLGPERIHPIHVRHLPADRVEQVVALQENDRRSLRLAFAFPHRMIA